MTLPYQVMAKPVGAICNLNCRYCFYLEKEHLYQTDPAKIFMSVDVLESFIRQKLETSVNQTESFTWQGGEPTLLDVDYYRKILAIQQKYANGKKVKNAFQTNGILLNDEWCRLFAENDFLVGISIDGPEEFHDHYRIDKGGHPTFSAVLEGIELLKKHGVSFNTLTVVNDHNADKPQQVYEFLKDIGSQFQQYIPIVERKRINSSDDRLELVLPDTDKARITDWSVKPEQYGKFLIDIFDVWVRNDVGNIFVQLFDVALEVWAGLPASLCIFSETCGRALALEYNGDLYSCDHFVFPRYRLGNILEQPIPTLVDSDQQIKFGNDKQNRLPDYCQRCDVKFICQGGCPKNRFMTTPTGESGLNYLCPAYKTFFQYIDPYMKFMTGELRCGRPPANVMKWIAENDQNS